MEDVCLSKGFQILLENSSASDLEYPITEEALKGGKILTGKNFSSNKTNYYVNVKYIKCSSAIIFSMISGGGGGRCWG